MVFGGRTTGVLHSHGSTKHLKRLRLQFIQKALQFRALTSRQSPVLILNEKMMEPFALCETRVRLQCRQCLG
jgi:hypothetical protein